MSIESTCIGEKCIFWEKQNGEIICPFFINTLWKENEKSVPVTLNDCAPKRNTIMLMDYSSRAIGIQKDYEEQRNMYEKVLKGVGQVVTEIQKRNKMLSDKIGIVYNKENIELIDN